MGIFKKQYQVKPNTVGFLYRNNVFEEKLMPGFHEIWDWKNRTELLTLPETSKLLTITNQEVLSKDNIALRFSDSRQKNHFPQLELLLFHFLSLRELQHLVY